MHNPQVPATSHIEEYRSAVSSVISSVGDHHSKGDVVGMKINNEPDADTMEITFIVKKGN